MYIMESTVLRRVSGPVRRVSRMLTRYLEISGVGRDPWRVSGM